MSEDHVTVNWITKCEYDFWEDEIKEVRDYYNSMLEDEEITLADAIQTYLIEEHNVYLPQAAIQQIESFIKEHEET